MRHKSIVDLKGGHVRDLGLVRVFAGVVAVVLFAPVGYVSAAPPPKTFEALSMALTSFANTNVINQVAYGTCGLARDEFEKRECEKDKREARAEIEKKPVLFVDQPVVVGDYDFKRKRFPLYISKIVFGAGIGDSGPHEKYVAFTLGRVKPAARNATANALVYYIPMADEAEARAWKTAVSRSVVTADIVAKFKGFYQTRSAWGEKGKVANMRVLGVRIRDLRTGQILYSSPASGCVNYRDCYLARNFFYLGDGKPAPALYGDVEFALSGVPDKLRVMVDGIVLNRITVYLESNPPLRSQGGTVQTKLAAGKHILEFEFDNIHEGTPKGPYVLDLKAGEKLFVNFQTVMDGEEGGVLASRGEAQYEAQEFLGLKMGQNVAEALPRLPRDREVVNPGFKDTQGRPLPVQGYKYKVANMPGVQYAQVIFFEGKLYNISLLYDSRGHPGMKKLIAYYTEKLGPPSEHSRKAVITQGDVIWEEAKWETKTTNALLRLMSDQAVEFHLFETAITKKLEQMMGDKED